MKLQLGGILYIHVLQIRAQQNEMCFMLIQMEA